MKIVGVIARNLGEIYDFIVFFNIVMRLIQCEEHRDKKPESNSNTPIWYGQTIRIQSVPSVVKPPQLYRPCAH